MMKPKAVMTFTALIELDEAEVRMLNHLCGYSAEEIARVLRERITNNFDEKILTLLMSRLRDETYDCIRRYDAARAAFTPKG